MPVAQDRLRRRGTNHDDRSVGAVIVVPRRRCQPAQQNQVDPERRSREVSDPGGRAQGAESRSCDLFVREHLGPPSSMTRSSVLTASARMAATSSPAMGLMRKPPLRRRPACPGRPSGSPGRYPNRPSAAAQGPRPDQRDRPGRPARLLPRPYRGGQGQRHGRELGGAAWRGARLHGPAPLHRAPRPGERNRLAAAEQEVAWRPPRRGEGHRTVPAAVRRRRRPLRGRAPGTPRTHNPAAVGSSPTRLTCAGLSPAETFFGCWGVNFA